MIAILTEQQFNDILPKLPSGVIVGVPCISTDGRRAVCHPFTDDDINFLQQNSAILVDSLPNDWEGINPPF